MSGIVGVQAAREYGAADYRLYGLSLRTSLSLPCPRARPGERPDVELRAGGSIPFRLAHTDGAADGHGRDWFRCRKLTDGSTYVRWTGLFEFVISPDGRRIQYRRLERATRESFSVYLLGQILSFSLLAFGVDPLHGTAAVVDGDAVAFVGDCGSGKSTLAAALLARGFPVLTDDVVALEPRAGGWAAHPGIPRLKLFPSVARRLLAPAARATAMNPGTTKLVLPLGGAQAARRMTPLKAIYVLSRPAPRRTRATAHVHIEDLQGRTAFLEVVRAAFNLIVVDRERLAGQFRFANQLVADVPVRRLTYPRRLSCLPAVCDAVLADCTR